MRRKKGFTLRNVCGESIVVAQGKENIDFSKIISMNESAAFLWEKLGDKDFTVADMAALLTSEYEVDADMAAKDCENLAMLWLENGIVEP